MNLLDALFWIAFGVWFGSAVSGNHTLMWIAVGVEWAVLLIKLIIALVYHHKHNKIAKR
jgi:uncharacterized membrane protein